MMSSRSDIKFIAHFSLHASRQVSAVTLRAAHKQPASERHDFLGPICCVGKWMCDANRTLAQQACVVLSLGSNGQTDFETAILQRAPHCKVTC